MKREENKRIFEDILNNKNYILLGEYINGDTSTLIKHLDCGLEFKTKPHTFKRDNTHGYCPNCFYTKNQTPENLEYKLNKFLPGEYTFNKDDYKGFSKAMKFKHKCGHIVNTSPTILLKRKRKDGVKIMCKRCSGYDVTTESCKKDIERVSNGEYEMFGEYVKETIPITLKHKECGEVYSTTTRKNFVNGGIRCPFCYKERSFSKTEREIIKILKTNNLKYEYDFKLDNDLNVSKTKYYKYDFYIPDINLIIEVDGNQHFRPWGGKNSKVKKGWDRYNRRVLIDDAKNLIIKNKNYNMIRIKGTMYLDTLRKLMNEILDNNLISSTTIDKYGDNIMYIQNGIYYNEENYYMSRVQPSG